MRIGLVAHGFPPEERTGVETYTESLAARLAGLGHQVEVFVPRPDEALADLAMRRELREVAASGRLPAASFGVTRIATNQPPRDPAEMLDPPGVAERFGDFLDRERPQLVHFQHVIKLGLGLVEAATERAIPTVFTAHDYYGLCHRYTLLRPDLEVCLRPGEAEACARCDLGLAVLNRVEGLGDYQMGVCPERLSAAVAEELAATLDGEPTAAGFDPEEWSAAQERRAELDERRRTVLAGIDLRLAPSRFLAERLEASGLGAVEHFPNGIDCADLLELAATPPGQAGDGAPLALAYIGGLAKHKGVEVLLEAFGKLERERPGAATLAIHGYSTDTAWVAELEALAHEVGADWRGGYQRGELPAILAAADLVVVPSTWYENYPIAIREAHAAGRPVVASRLGALSESVRDGVDGALFEAGNADDLARVLARVARDPKLLARWAAAIEPVHTMELQAVQLVARYAALIAAADERRLVAEDFAARPASMRPFVQRLAELERLPTRTLFAEVVSGLGALGEALAVAPHELRADRIFERAFVAGDAAQRSLRDARREVDWLRRSLESAATTEADLVQQLEWKQGIVEDREAAVAEAEGRLEQAAVERADQEVKLSWLEDEVARRDAVIVELNAALAQKDAVIVSRDEELEWMRGKEAALIEERDWVKSELELREGELIERAEQLGLGEERIAELLAGLEQAERDRRELEQLLHQRLHEVAEVGLLALESQEHALIRGLAPMFEALDRASGHHREAQIGPDQPWDASRERIERGLAELVQAVELGLARLGELEAELDGRRAEMDGAIEESRRLLPRLLLGRSGLGRRMGSWQRHDSADATGASEAPDATDATEEAGA